MRALVVALMLLAPHLAAAQALKPVIPRVSAPVVWPIAPMQPAADQDSAFARAGYRVHASKGAIIGFGIGAVAGVLVARAAYHGGTCMGCPSSGSTTVIAGLIGGLLGAIIGEVLGGHPALTSP